MFWDPVGLSNKLSCGARSFLCCHLNPQGVFNQWFEAFFPQAGTVGLCDLFRSPFVSPDLSALECGTAQSTSCSLLGSCSLDCPAPQSTASLGPPATVLLRVLSAQLPVPTPPTGLDECLLYLLGCQTSIQFNFLSVLVVFKLSFWLCKEAQCVYLHLHLGQKSPINVIF